MVSCWQGLALGTEVSVVTNSALVTVSNNVVGDFLAQWAVAVDAVVNYVPLGREWDRFIERNETMAWMGSASIFDAIRAKVPIWALQAFVASTINVLHPSECVDKYRTNYHSLCRTHRR